MATPYSYPSPTMPSYQPTRNWADLLGSALVEGGGIGQKEIDRQEQIRQWMEEMVLRKKTQDMQAEAADLEKKAAERKQAAAMAAQSLLQQGVTEKQDVSIPPFVANPSLIPDVRRPPVPAMGPALVEPPISASVDVKREPKYEEVLTAAASGMSPEQIVSAYYKPEGADKKLQDWLALENAKHGNRTAQAEARHKQRMKEIEAYNKLRMVFYAKFGRGGKRDNPGDWKLTMDEATLMLDATQTAIAAHQAVLADESAEILEQEEAAKALSQALTDRRALLAHRFRASQHGAEPPPPKGKKRVYNPATGKIEER